MKNFTQNSKKAPNHLRLLLGTILMIALMMPTIAVSQSPVDLGTSGNFVVLAKSGISATGTTSIVGNIGVSPIDHTAITGFSLILDPSGEFATSSLVTGKVYAADYASPTPTILSTAVSDMETAYTDAAGRAADYTELYAGDLTGQTLTAGVYKWGTNVLVSAGGVTISGSPSDVWIFQIAGDLTIASTAIINLSGGAKASNIFWQVAGQVILGTTSDFSGIILCQTQIAMQTGAAFDGIALAQTAVTLDGNSIVDSNPSINVCATDNPQPIPAVGTGGSACTDPTFSPATVSGTGNIGVGPGNYTLDSIEVELTHTWASDIDMYLISPGGAITIELSTDNGGSTGLDTAATLVFTDSSVNAITGWTGGAPLANYKAEGGLLNTLLAGLSINGDWTLRICDDSGGDSGTLLSYCINFSEIIGGIGNPPTIACPADIVINNSPGTCGAVVNFSGIAIDDEDGNISGSIIATPASGSTFAVGVTTVELSVTDSDGNNATCEFTVTVIDNEVPVAVCQDITVDLDPVTGLATITGADVNNGSTDNCSIASYALGIASGATSGGLSTLYTGGNGGSNGGAVYFDLTVGPNDIDVTSIDVNTGEAGSITLNVYTLVGTYVGNTTSPAPWGAAVATGTGTGAGANNASNVTLGSSLTLNAGTTYGVALVLDAAHAWDYTNGDGTNQNYGNADLSLALGSTSNLPFTAPTFTPRIFNGGINYSIAAGTVPFSGVFDCSNVGPNTISLIVTDASGNSSTCTSTVTVQDITAPVINCLGGIANVTESEDFEGASVPAGWSTVIQTGAYDWTFGSGDMPSGADFPTNAAIFDDDAAGPGAVNVASLLSPVYDISAATTATVSFDYILKDFIGFGFLNVEVYDGAAWQQILLVDDIDVGPINTGDLDMMPYANANFQVRFTYDDQGSWAYGAGVDNFLLNYEIAAGGGLDVYLDADGMASVNPNDLILSVDEACGYTITAGGGGGGTSGSLTTLFATNNGGSSGWAVMYDVTVGPADIEVTELDINANATSAFTADLYVLTGTYVGNELNPAAWGAPAASGSGTGAGTDLPSNVVLGTPVMLLANTTYGFAVVTTGVGQSYTNGDGTNQNYSNGDLSIALGSAVTGLFTGSVFTPRIWNGAIHYTTAGSGGGLDFTCADLGENQVEVTVTDDSGNVSTCIATVNVIDNIAPIITCGTVEIELGPDGTTTVDPYSLLSNVDEACGISTIAVDVPTVDCSDIGTTIMITVFVSDASGNIASCSATVTVVDLLAPVITCPADQTVDPGAGNLFYIVPDYFATGEATAVDNCTDPVTLTTQSPAPGTALPEGPHTITMTATDEYGNVSTCSFVLTVQTVLGVDANSLDKGLALYPNPASNVVNLVNKTNISLEKMMIYDINGKLVSQTDLRTMQGEKAVDVSSLAAGVYVVQIIGDNATTVKRLIKE